MENEAERAPEPGPTKMPTRQQFIDANVQNAVTITLQGLIHTIPGATPQDIIFAFAAQAGALLGKMVQVGDLVPILNMRKEIKDRFREALDAQTPLPPPNGAPQGPKQ